MLSLAKLTIRIELNHYIIYFIYPYLTLKMSSSTIKSSSMDSEDNSEDEADGPQYCTRISSALLKKTTKRSSREGDEFQVEIEEYNPKKSKKEESPIDMECTWSASTSSSKGDAIDQYLRIANFVINATIRVDCIDGSVAMKVSACDDILLDILHRCNYDHKKALDQVEIVKQDLIVLWTKEEQRLVTKNDWKYNGNLNRIISSLGTKTRAEVTDFYYRYSFPSNYVEGKILEVTGESSHDRKYRQNVDHTMSNQQRLAAINVFVRLSKILNKHSMARISNAFLQYSHCILSLMQLYVIIYDVLDSTIDKSAELQSIYKEFTLLLPEPVQPFLPRRLR